MAYLVADSAVRNTTFRRSCWCNRLVMQGALSRLGCPFPICSDVVVKETVTSSLVCQDRCSGCLFPWNSWTVECASLHALLQEVDPQILSNSAFMHANVDSMPALAESRSQCPTLQLNVAFWRQSSFPLVRFNCRPSSRKTAQVESCVYGLRRAHLLSQGKMMSPHRTGATGKGQKAGRYIIYRSDRQRASHFSINRLFRQYPRVGPG